MRRDFGSLKMRRAVEKKNHPHGLAAGSRAVAKHFMADFALRTGLDPYQVQQSLSDQRHGVAGNRTFYWSKDVSMDYSFTLPGKRNLVLLTDVDYYMNMPWFLAWTARPTLLYSFVPSTLARADGQSTHYFNDDGTVEQHIADAGTYRHKLWNYGADNCVASWKLCGIPIITTVYHIARRNVDEDRQLIFLSPISYFYGPLS